jgi:hypothetical protein
MAVFNESLSIMAFCWSLLRKFEYLFDVVFRDCVIISNQLSVFHSCLYDNMANFQQSEEELASAANEKFKKNKLAMNVNINVLFNFPIIIIEKL